MKNSTVRKEKNRSKISWVGVGQPNARRKMPIVTSIATPASTPASTPIRRTARKDRVAVDSVVAFILRRLRRSQRGGSEVYAESFAPDGHRAVFRQVQVVTKPVILIADVALEDSQ